MHGSGIELALAVGMRQQALQEGVERNFVLKERPGYDDGRVIVARTAQTAKGCQPELLVVGKVLAPLVHYRLHPLRIVPGDGEAPDIERQSGELETKLRNDAKIAATPTANRPKQIVVGVALRAGNFDDVRPAGKDHAKTKQTVAG